VLLKGSRVGEKSFKGESGMFSCFYFLIERTDIFKNTRSAGNFNWLGLIFQNFLTSLTNIIIWMILVYRSEECIPENNLERLGEVLF
jgi:hypothetical protein